MTDHLNGATPPDPLPIEQRLFMAQVHFGHALMRAGGMVSGDRVSVNMEHMLGEIAFLREWLTMLSEHYCAMNAIPLADMQEALIARLDARIAELSKTSIAIAPAGALGRKR